MDRQFPHVTDHNPNLQSYQWMTKAITALAQTTEAEVLAALLQWAAEISRAPRADLILIKEQPIVAATWTNSQGSQLQSTQLACSDHLPIDLIQTVLQQANPIAQSATTAKEPVSTQPPQSLLCLPLQHSDLIGALYLEHPQAEAFSAEQVECLQALCSQAALTLENIQLRQALQHCTQQETPLEIQNSLLEQIATDCSLATILEQLVEAIESQLPGARCSISRLNTAGQLYYQVAPQLPLAYVQATNGITVSDSGSYAAAIASQQRVIVCDINHSCWPPAYKTIALECGLQAAWSSPIFANQAQVAGSFSIYYRSPKTPTAHELQLMEMAANLASIAIERQQARQALQFSEQQLQMTLELTQIGAWSWQPSTNTYRWNDNMQRLLEIPREQDNMYQLWRDRIYAEDVESVEAAIAQGLATQTDFAVEYRYWLTNGDLVWRRVKGQGIYDAAGHLHQVLGVLFDITDRKQIELSLRSVEAQQRSVLAHVPSYIVEVDAQGKMLFLNRTAPGFTLEQVIGMYLDDFTAPESQAMQRAALAAVFATGEGKTIETLGTGAYGQPADYEVRIAPVFQEGQVKSAILITTDITDRKQAEVALRNSERRYATLTEAAPVGIFHTDISGNCLYVNSKWCEIAGLTPEAAAGKGWVNAIHPDDRDWVTAAWYESAQNNQPFWAEYRFCRPDGRVSQLVGQAVAERDETGQIVGYIGTITDTSDRKHTEAALQISEERLRMLINSLPFGVWVRDANDRLILQNPVDMARYGNQLGTPIEDLDLSPEWVARCHQVKQTYPIGQFAQYEVVESIAGEDRSLLRIVAPLPDLAGGIGMFGITIDITERKQAEQTLQSLVAGTAAVTGTDFFPILSEQIAIALDVSHVVVSQRQQSQLTTLAIYADHQLQPNFSYPMAQTPCELTIQNHSYYCPQDLQLHFPHHLTRIGQQIESYLGVALRNSAGEGMGVLCVLNQQPIADPARALTLLQIFAARAAAELERIQALQDLQQFNEQLEHRVQERTIALEQSQQQLQEIFNVAPVGILQAEAQTSLFLKFNQQFCDFFGYSPAELSQLTLADLTHPDDLASSQERLEPLSQGAIRSFSLEKRYIRKDGSIAWGHITMAQLNHRNDNSGQIVILQDITARKQAELLLQAEQLQLQLALQAAQMGTWECNLETGQLIWSERAEAIFGFAPGTFPGDRDNFIARIHPNDRERVLAAISNSFSTRSPYHTEYRIHRLDETLRWIAVWGIIVESADRTTLRMVGVVIDITDRKQTEEALRDSEERLRLALMAANQGLYDLNVQTGDAIVNVQYATMLGYDPAEFQETNAKWIERLHPDDLEPVANIYQAYVSGELPEYRVEFRQRTKSGDWKWILSLGKIVARDADHNPLRMLGTHTDISDRKQIEADLQQRVEQERILNQVVQVIRSSLDLKTIFSTATQALTQLLEIDKVLLMQYDSTAASWVQVAEHRRNLALPDTTGATIPEPQASFSQRSHSLAMLQVETIEALPDQMPQRLTQAVGSWLLVPLEVNQAIWGTLGFIKPLGATYLATEIESVQRIADQLAIAIQQAELYQQVQTEKEKLRESEAALAQAQAIAHVGNWELDVVSQTLIWSEELFRMFRLDISQVELVYDQQFKYIHPDDRDRLKFYIDRAVFQGLPYEIDLRILRGDGTIGYIEARGEGLHSPDGPIIKLVGTALDITDRKRAELALQESEARMRATFEQAAVGMVQVNMQRQFIHVNQKFCDMLGYSEAELLTKTFAELTHPDDLAADLAQVEQLLTTDNTTFMLEKRYLHREGMIVWANLAVSLVRNSQAEPEYFIGVIQDIGDRKAAEEGLRQANAALESRVEQRTAELRQAKEAAEAANRAKSAFLANMSHELRTPLNGILGYAQILQRSPQLSSRDYKGVDTIRECGMHLLNLINDLLDLAKIEAQKLELIPQEIHLANFLANINDICQLKAQQKGLTFRYLPSNNLAIGVNVDAKRLRQILFNLLSNAIKFTDTGYVLFKIELSASLQSQQVNIRFQIKDTGVGIAPNQIQQIFLPFEQVGYTARPTEGTGLGLAITRTLIQQMGSELKVESVPGQGSCFTFTLTLPVLTSTASAALPQPATGPIVGFKGSAGKILIVDDHWTNRAILIDFLQPLGFVLAEATNGQEALEKAMTFGPDLIITDLLMPVMDGWELTRRIRSSALLQDTLVFATSASVSAQTQQQCQAAGCNQFLAKPIQTEHLLDQLQLHLHLEWVYAHPEVPVAAASAYDSAMITPPAAALHRLHELAKRGRVLRIAQQAEQLQQQDDRLSEFTDHLMQLAQAFEVEKLQQFIEQALTHTQPES